MNTNVKRTVGSGVIGLAAAAALMSSPTRAANITYALADVSGKMKVSIPTEQAALGGSTADAHTGVQVAGNNFGGDIFGASGNTATWKGTMAANGTFTADPTNGLTAVAPASSSINYRPNGFWNPAGQVNIPTSGYFGVAKNTGPVLERMSRSMGNSMADATASWRWDPGVVVGGDWSGTERATVGKVVANGAAAVAPTRAASHLTDPIYFNLSSSDAIRFSVSLEDVVADIAADGDAIGNAYFMWSVDFGQGSFNPSNVLTSWSGGADYTTVGHHAETIGTVVDYNTVHSSGQYWLATSFSMAANAVPEPGAAGVIALAAGALGLRRRRQQRIC